MLESALLHCLSQIICLMGGKSSSGSDPVCSQSEVCILKFFCLSDIELLDTNDIAQSCHVNTRTNSLMRKNYIFLPFALLCERIKNNKCFPVSPHQIVAKFFLRANEVPHSDEVVV